MRQKCIHSLQKVNQYTSIYHIHIIFFLNNLPFKQCNVQVEWVLNRLNTPKRYVSEIKLMTVRALGKHILHEATR